MGCTRWQSTHRRSPPYRVGQMGWRRVEATRPGARDLRRARRGLRDVSRRWRPMGTRGCRHPGPLFPTHPPTAGVSGGQMLLPSTRRRPAPAPMRSRQRGAGRPQPPASIRRRRRTRSTARRSRGSERLRTRERGLPFGGLPLRSTNVEDRSGGADPQVGRSPPSEYHAEPPRLALRSSRSRCSCST